jgi:hypothetical protein
MAITCPCFGFGYAQQGKLFLLRRRAGNPAERLALSPLFAFELDSPATEGADPLAALPRWGEPILPGDAERESKGDPDLATEIMHRRKSTTMKLADYDHDGRATEFLLHVGNVPCGKQYDVVVGISKSEPRLHALSSIAKPDEPLLLPQRAWAALLSGTGEHNVIELECGDHGSEVHEELVISAEKGKIRARRRTFSCPFDGTHRTLTTDKDL